MRKEYITPETVAAAMPLQQFICASTEGNLEDFTDGGTYNW